MHGHRLAALVGLALATGAAAAIPAGAFGSAHAASTHTVTLKNFRFHPGTLTIHRGDRVKWVWAETEREHNVTFRHFHSRTQESGSFTWKFSQRGTFRYRCTIHEEEGMLGKIIVR
jgi:plastocyanin